MTATPTPKQLLPDLPDTYTHAMIASTQEEINEHNKKVEARKRDRKLLNQARRRFEMENAE
jgi:hypothetical protein